MIDFQALATPPREVPRNLTDAAKITLRQKTPQTMRMFEKVLEREDKYYFSTSEAHALDRRTK